MVARFLPVYLTKTYLTFFCMSNICKTDEAATKDTGCLKRSDTLATAEANQVCPHVNKLTQVFYRRRSFPRQGQLPLLAILTRLNLP